MKNYICNGGFEDPQIPSGALQYNEIPCWKADNHIEIGKCEAYGVCADFNTQVMELDGRQFKQKYQ